MSSHRLSARRARLRFPRSRRFSRSFLLASLCLLAFIAPAGANVLPPGQIFFQVEPYADWEDCIPDVTICEDADASIVGTGDYFIHLLIDPPQWFDGEPITSLSLDLYWPEEWYLYWYSPCTGGEGSLDEYGPNPHRLEMTWPCTNIHYEAFPAVTLVFHISGYGVVYPEQDGQGALGIGCPPQVNFESPYLSFAEAGTLCEHDVEACEWSIDAHCAPGFAVEEFSLSGPSGAIVYGDYPFVTGEGHDYGCHPWAAVDDAWLGARVEAGGNPWDWNLLLKADLTELVPGTYSTNVHVAARYVERCLPAVLVVEAPSAVEPPTATTDPRKAARLLSIEPNPSAGPFTLTYEAWAGTGPALCTIHDASGREISKIRGGRGAGVGRQTMTWDGCGPDGRPVTPGVYLVRLDADGTGRVGRVVVVR